MTTSDHLASLPAPPERRLELYTEYRCEVTDMSFGHIPRATLRKMLANGRIAGWLLEAEIAAVMGLRVGTQGASPDLYDELIGTIQCKTFKAEPNPAAVVKRGRHAGRLRSEVAKIWTTKSGYWDRRSRMTAEHHVDAEDYFDHYDAFMYIDISQMEQGRFAFITLPSADVIARKQQYLISEAAIRDLVQRIEIITDSDGVDGVATEDASSEQALAA